MLLTLPSGDYSVLLIPGVGAKPLTQFQRIEKVSVKSSTISVFLGGLAGAFIMALFFPVYESLSAKRSVPASFKEIKDKSAPYLARLPLRLGGLVAVMLIVITRSTTDLHLPIAIKVEDFFGGLIAGLLSLIFAKWLAQSLTPKNETISVEKK